MDRPYCRVWRPGTPARYCLERDYAADFHQLCGEYSGLENRLRALLDRRGASDEALQTGGWTVYRLLREARYELDHNLCGILRANGYPGRPRDWGWRDFAALEPLMRLSGYRVRLPAAGRELELCPFAHCQEGPPAWYRGEYPLIFPGRGAVEQATLQKALEMVAALHCVLYGQFGENLSAALRPRGAREGAGYFTASSIFVVQPPDFPEEERYGFRWEEIKKKKGWCTPFFGPDGMRQ